jgi:aspartyl-tRNA(Asn)/glutamyl-tRNA(Gln) amidotransferase subunit C
MLGFRYLVRPTLRFGLTENRTETSAESKIEKMNIDKESLQKIAHLSRLELPESAEREMMDSLNSVLTWMEELNEINTDNIKPLTHMSLEINALREDKVIPNISREQGLKNAPKQDGEYFRVPKVIE